MISLLIINLLLHSYFLLIVMSNFDVAPIIHFNQTVYFVDNLFEIFKSFTAGLVVAANSFDDGSLDKAEFVFSRKLNWLNGEVFVVRAADLSVECGGFRWLADSTNLDYRQDITVVFRVRFSKFYSAIKAYWFH